MASGECVCCGQPTTVPESYYIEPNEECDCGCFDCDECEGCYHSDKPILVTPAVLCDDCREEDIDEGIECGPGAWHCRCGRSCDGSACPGDLRGPDDGGAT